MRSRLETVALIATGIAVIAFVLSFALGLRDGKHPAPVLRARPGEEQAIAAPLSIENRRRVEVLNASGRAGLAREATLRLRDAGYDVVYFGNASTSDEDRSVVFDRVGDPAVARGAARVLGITNVVTRIDSTRMVEASVVLTEDWQVGPPDDAGRQRWWKRLTDWLRPGR